MYVRARLSVTPGFAKGSLGRKACLQSDRFETSSGDMPEQLTSWLGLLVNAVEFIINQLRPWGN